MSAQLPSNSLPFLTEVVRPFLRDGAAPPRRSFRFRNMRSDRLKRCRWRDQLQLLRSKNADDPDGRIR